MNTRYEYHTLSTVSFLGGDAGYVAEMNRLGEAGWKLIALDHFKNLIFMREVKSEGSVSKQTR